MKQSASLFLSPKRIHLFLFQQSRLTVKVDSVLGTDQPVCVIVCCSHPVLDQTDVNQLKLKPFCRSQ